MAGDFEFEGEPTPKKTYGHKGNGQLVEIGEYKGNPVISLRRTPDDLKPFTFGLAKAKLIMDNIDAVEKFVQDNKK